MGDKNKSFSQNKERGNAMVYVLVIVALFAALSFVVARQGDTSEASVIDQEKVEIYAGNIQQTAMQMKQSIDQMLWTGSTVNFTSANAMIDFITPGEAGYDTAPNINKLFHPAGGGVVMPRLPEDAVNETAAPAANWYINRNNVEWTPSTDDDIILTAYQINEQVCARLNEKLTGSSDIPVLNVPAPTVLIYSSASDLTATVCQDGDSPANDVDCDGKPSLCVKDSVGTWSFFSLLATE